MEIRREHACLQRGTNLRDRGRIFEASWFADEARKSSNTMIDLQELFSGLIKMMATTR